jgi:hypothetical protein
MTIYHRTLRVLASITILAILGLVAGCNSTSLRPSAITTSSASTPAPIAESVQTPHASVAPAPTSTPLYSDGNADVSVSVFEVSRKGDPLYTLSKDGFLQFRSSVFNKSPGVITVTGIKARYADSSMADSVRGTLQLTERKGNVVADLAETATGFIPGLGSVAAGFVAGQYESGKIHRNLKESAGLSGELFKLQQIAPNSPSTGKYMIFPNQGKVVGLVVFYTDNPLSAAPSKSYELSLQDSTVADTGSVALPIK